MIKMKRKKNNKISNTFAIKKIERIQKIHFNKKIVKPIFGTIEKTTVELSGAAS